MHDVGTALLYVTFVAMLGTTLTAFAGAALRSPGWLQAARHGLMATWLLILAMSACLVVGLVTHDFRNQYIAAYTDVDMPLPYLLSGFWGGEKGALLFWVTALTTFGVFAILRNRSQTPVFLGWVTGFLGSAIAFFVMLMVFESNPFETFAAGLGPADGKGMNPLLQNPLMAVHPPSLLTGYIAFTLPYAFGMAALATGQLDAQWLRDTRKWTLVSWLFLSLGLILGGAWAYNELGWGGFWMWDPVENAGLIPWFTATAFLHSVMIQERRNMLKRWNVVLVCLTFLLTVFGTFLTRSQLIDSVHAFADSTLASYFLWYMAAIIVVSTVLIAWRWGQLRAEASLDSLLSREAFFVFNNVLLVGCAFVVLWGTVFGQISEAKPVQALHNAFADALATIGVHIEPLAGKVQLGEPWFNRVMTPLGLGLLLMTGVGPLIAWRRATRRNFERNFARPIVWSALVTLFVSVGWLARDVVQTRDGGPWGAAWTRTVDALDGSHAWGIACIGLSAFVIVAIAREFHVAARARQRGHGDSYGLALVLLTLKNKRRYGGYVVHIGVVFCFLAFAGNAFRTYQPEIALHPGESVAVGGYGLTFAGGEDVWEADGAYVSSRARIVVTARDGTVAPELVATVLATVRRFDAAATAVARPGSAALAIDFADAAAGRRFAAAWTVPRLGRLATPAHVPAADARVLALELSSAMMEVAAVAPQAVMKAFAEVRSAVGQYPVPVEVRTTPGQTRFELAFGDAAARSQFAADLRRIPLAGFEFVAVDADANLAAGVRVQAVPLGAGAVLVPEVRNYKKHQSPTTEVAIQSAFDHDLYLAMRPAQAARSVSLLAVVFPFIGLLWLGAITLLVGGAICLLPAQRTAAATESDPESSPLTGHGGHSQPPPASGLGDGMPAPAVALAVEGS